MNKIINALIKMFKLENNEYTQGTIETLINGRLDMSDCFLFMAFLSERDTNYEKPIESIAKGINEYIETRLRPFKNQAIELHKGMWNKKRYLHLDNHKLIKLIHQGKLHQIMLEGECFYTDFEIKLIYKARDFVPSVEFIYQELGGKMLKPTIRKQIEKKSNNQVKNKMRLREISNVKKI